MNKKILKTVLILLLMLYLGMANSLPVFATNPPNTPKSATTWSVDDFSGFDDVVVSNQSITGATQNVMGTIINTIRIVGTGVSIIMITYVAIKYMSAAPNEKAEFKKSAMAFIVGAVILFASSNLLGVIADFATKNIEKPAAKATTQTSQGSSNNGGK